MRTSVKQKFIVELIKPSHYDDDGYVIQWKKAAVPSNTLSCLYGLTLDCVDRRVLGDDVARNADHFPGIGVRLEQQSPAGADDFGRVRGESQRATDLL